jgi:hypothetical protein
LLDDDIDNLKYEIDKYTFINNKKILYKNIHSLKSLKNLNELSKTEEFIFLIVFIDNITEHIKFMNDYGFIPFDIINTSKNYLGVSELKILFINKKHKLNLLVNSIL